MDSPGGGTRIVVPGNGGRRSAHGSGVQIVDRVVDLDDVKRKSASQTFDIALEVENNRVVHRGKSDVVRAARVAIVPVAVINIQLVIILQIGASADAETLAVGRSDDETRKVRIEIVAVPTAGIDNGIAPTRLYHDRLRAAVRHNDSVARAFGNESVAGRDIARVAFDVAFYRIDILPARLQSTKGYRRGCRIDSRPLTLILLVAENPRSGRHRIDPRNRCRGCRRRTHRRCQVRVVLVDDVEAEATSARLDKTEVSAGYPLIVRALPSAATLVVVVTPPPVVPDIASQNAHLARDGAECALQVYPVTIIGKIIRTCVGQIDGDRIACRAHNDIAARSRNRVSETLARMLYNDTIISNRRKPAPIRLDARHSIVPNTVFIVTITVQTTEDDPVRIRHNRIGSVVSVGIFHNPGRNISTAVNPVKAHT